MSKPEFGDVIRSARAGKNLSLRRLASLSGVEYSRLSRIEQGTRPAPDLAGIRSLASALDLDVGELLIAAGTSRSVMEDLVWSERARLARAEPDLGGYEPEEQSRLLARNTFDGRVLRRRGALCVVAFGGARVRVLASSQTRWIRVAIPPATVMVSTGRPPESGAASTVLEARVLKVRWMGPLVNLVVSGDGFSLNSVRAAARDEELPAQGDTVYVTLLTAAIRTTPLEEDR